MPATAYNYAVYNQETELSFYQNKANTGGSKIKLYIEFVPHHLSNVANISVEEFARIITRHFLHMVYVEEKLANINRTYSGSEIPEKLRLLSGDRLGGDLFFFK